MNTLFNKFTFIYIAFVVLIFGFGNIKSVYASTSIANCAELQNMSSNLSEDYVLANDIDCTGFDLNSDGKGFMPVGTFANPFTGSLNGNNFTISNINIVRTQGHIGLFGYINGSNGDPVVINNLNIQGTYTSTATGGGIGGLVGYGAHVLIDNVSVNILLNTNTTFDIGGLAGTLDQSTLINSDSSGTINAPLAGFGTGGLIGYLGSYNEASRVTLATSTSSVDININGPSVYVQDVGGLVGYVNDSGSIAKINNVSSSGDINITSNNVDHVGGVVGYAGSTMFELNNSFYSGAINITTANLSTLNNGIGGLIGYVDNSVKIDSSHVTGNLDINSTSFIKGGIAGLVGKLKQRLNSSVNNSYMTGNISVSSGDYINGGIGGLIGHIFSDVGNNVIGINSSYMTGNLTVNSGSYIDKGVGGLVGNSNRPISFSETYNTGAIDLTSATYVYNGVGGILGVGYYGQTIDKSYNSGDIHVNAGSYVDYGVGGLMGYSDDVATISDSFSLGDIVVTAVTNANYIGGIVGIFDWIMDIDNSYSIGGVTVTAASGDGVGGMVGKIDNANSSINNSFSTGAVTANGSFTNVGGMVGAYATSTFVNNFYDKTSSNQSFCTGKDNPDPVWCVGITQPGYFLNNNTNAPLSSVSWDFNNVWEKTFGNYPNLQALNSPYSVVPQIELSTINSSVSSITSLSAILSSTIISTGGENASDSGFKYGTISDLSASTTVSTGAQVGTSTFTYSLSGLSPSTTYYYKSYVVNSAGTAYSDIKSFVTSAVVQETSSRSSSGSYYSFPGTTVPVVTSNTGLVNKLSLPASTLKASFTRDLKLKSQGSDVKKLQELLISKGYSIPAGTTGYFGEQTKKALIKFQKEKKITPAIGYFGEKTKKIINQ